MSDKALHFLDRTVSELLRYIDDLEQQAEGDQAMCHIYRVESANLQNKCNALAANLERVTSELKSQQESWVRVEDELPEFDVPVLCWHPELGVRRGRRLGSGAPYVRPEGCMGYDEEVLHWKPLPPPPKH